VPSPLDQADLRQRVQACIDGELVHQREVLAEIGPDVDDLLDAIGLLLTGGKRLRAAFLYWGTGRPVAPTAMQPSVWRRRWSSSRARR
jgi:geranylgeranyl diphosphate synthase type I